MDSSTAVLTSNERYTKFIFKDKTITFLHEKDLKRYLQVKECKDGYLVVDCLGGIKGQYEDYIDMPYILENLYMDPQRYLEGMKEVVVRYV